MIRCVSLTLEKINLLEGLYRQFQEQAASDYRWDYPPLDFEDFIPLIENQTFFGYLVEDTTVTEPIGFMLYRLETHRSIEINMVYLKAEQEPKVPLDRLMRKFIQDIRKLPDWDVVSWAMLGRQMEFMRTVTWYGFKPVGQAIVRFDFTDPLSMEIFRKQKNLLPPLPDDYTISQWQDDYCEPMAGILYNAFEKASDAFWDPRFRSEAGAIALIELLTSGMVGDFISEGTAVLMKNGIPVAFCFLVQSFITKANIPLVGVVSGEKKKGLSRHLLYHVINYCLEQLASGQRTLLEINATVDTDNFPAIKMYRRMGFQEDYNYGHVYLGRELAESMVIGQWCPSS